MNDMYSKIVSQRSGLERIVARIPGFRGYKEMQARREADNIMREHVVQVLKEQLNRLVSIEKRLMQSGGLSLVGRSSEAKTRFQTYIDRVHTAAPGYSGFYSAQKIGPEELEKIYAFDAAQLEYADKIKAALDALDKAVSDKTGIEAAIDALSGLAQEANSAFQLRDNTLRGIV